MTQKRKADIILKDYWKDKEHFSDLYNAVLCGGREVFSPDDLVESDSDSSDVLEHRRFVENIKAARDVIKIVNYSKKYEAMLAILGIENQDKIHYAMPLRVMQYDTYCYKKQYDENAKRYSSGQGLTEEEFLSRMKRTDKFMPVITIVLYYGEKKWDGAKSLKELLTIPHEIDEYVNDYRMHLVQMGNNKLNLKNKHNKDLFQICEILYNHSKSLSERKKQIVEYAEWNKVDDSVLTAVGAAVGKEIRIERKEGKSMCTFFDELEKQYRQDGEIYGRTEEKFYMVKKMVERLGMTLEAACELAEITIESYKEKALIDTN